MKKIIRGFIFTFLFINISQSSFAWGAKGHEMVAKIAFHFLDDSTKKIVMGYLGKMSLGEAANWMDDSRGNSFYNYMRTWHYLDIDKGQKYTPSSERNILTVLHSAITELRQYQAASISRKDIKRDLLLLFHLIGDLHQPLHCGYAIDKGGNTIQVTSPLVSGNLHSVWDTQIIDATHIDMDSCLSLYSSLTQEEITHINKVDEFGWMQESRSFLDTVYSFKDNYLDKDYIHNNSLIIRKRLLLGGMRLAAVLNMVFNPSKAKESTPATN